MVAIVFMIIVTLSLIGAAWFVNWISSKKAIVAFEHDSEDFSSAEISTPSRFEKKAEEKTADDADEEFERDVILLAEEEEEVQALYDNSDDDEDEDEEFLIHLYDDLEMDGYEN